jgi:hypothetical protein
MQPQPKADVGIDNRIATKTKRTGVTVFSLSGAVNWGSLQPNLEPTTSSSW